MKNPKLYDTGQPAHEWFRSAADAVFKNVRQGGPPTVLVEIHGLRFELTAKATLPIGQRDDLRIKLSCSDLEHPPNEK